MLVTNPTAIVNPYLVVLHPTGNDNFCLHFNEKNKVMEIVLQAVSKEARYMFIDSLALANVNCAYHCRDIWVEELSEAITQATSAHADTFVLVGNRG